MILSEKSSKKLYINVALYVFIYVCVYVYKYMHIKIIMKYNNMLIGFCFLVLFFLVFNFIRIYIVFIIRKNIKVKKIEESCQVLKCKNL